MIYYKQSIIVQNHNDFILIKKWYHDTIQLHHDDIIRSYTWCEFIAIALIVLKILRSAIRNILKPYKILLYTWSNTQ
jgi:hypothetical protein